MELGEYVKKAANIGCVIGLEGSDEANKRFDELNLFINMVRDSRNYDEHKETPQELLDYIKPFDDFAKEICNSRGIDGLDNIE